MYFYMKELVLLNPSNCVIMLQIIRFQLFSLYCYRVQTISSSLILLPFKRCSALQLYLQLTLLTSPLKYFSLDSVFDSRCTFSISRVWLMIVSIEISHEFTEFTLNITIKLPTYVQVLLACPLSFNQFVNLISKFNCLLLS